MTGLEPWHTFPKQYLTRSARCNIKSEERHPSSDQSEQTLPASLPSYDKILYFIIVSQFLTTVAVTYNFSIYFMGADVPQANAVFTCSLSAMSYFNNDLLYVARLIVADKIRYFISESVAVASSAVLLFLWRVGYLQQCGFCRLSCSGPACQYCSIFCKLRAANSAIVASKPVVDAWSLNDYLMNVGLQLGHLVVLLFSVPLNLCGWRCLKLFSLWCTWVCSCYDCFWDYQSRFELWLF